MSEQPEMIECLLVLVASADTPDRALVLVREEEFDADRIENECRAAFWVNDAEVVIEAEVPIQVPADEDWRFGVPYQN